MRTAVLNRLGLLGLGLNALTGGWGDVFGAEPQQYLPSQAHF